MRACAILAALCVGPALLTADEKKDAKPTVKEIPTKDLKLTIPEKGKPTEPTTITSAGDLAKNEVVGKAADDIKEQIDFNKQKLLVFAWHGSGQDRMTASIGAEGKDLIVFVEFLPGKTKDFRPHTRLFAVPKDLKVVVDRGR